jgi:trehalose-phosphatase
MRVLNPQFYPDRFFERLRRAPQSVLMLDYDGTLAPFRTERDRAFPYPGVRELVAQLVAAEGVRTVVISGRAVSDVARLLDCSPLPEIWGSHGAERMFADGRYVLGASRERPAEGLAQVYWWARDKQILQHTERKPTGIAFHWRGLAADEAGRLRELVRSRWSEGLAGFDLELHEFDGGLEIRVAGISKADAVRGVLADEPEDAPAAYLGDDLTDEDAFSALADRGLPVLVRGELRETLAHVWLEPPDDLIAFLTRWLESSGRG